jgi:hypothetical protein
VDEGHHEARIAEIGLLSRRTERKNTYVYMWPSLINARGVELLDGTVAASSSTLSILGVWIGRGGPLAKFLVGLPSMQRLTGWLAAAAAAQG